MAASARSFEAVKFESPQIFTAAVASVKVSRERSGLKVMNKDIAKGARVIR